MMVHLWVNLEIADNRANYLVIRTITTLENLQLTLKYGEKQFHIAMLSTQKIDDHLHCSIEEPVKEVASLH
ncbi:hypothetical protein FBZ93_111176 [Bradyrhizobium macuxiense]|uniref:Uncharacterized protein n=1 Tax=Bradyrhizobium macuxiense TaxID=1755647 RepID=A0A560LCU7_9BRAD|nr:hypothetical protein FBZ93_111176 [Bradyrhizobium macuxiense]